MDMENGGMTSKESGTARQSVPKDLLPMPEDTSKRGRADADDSDKSYSSSKKRIRVSRACDQCRKRKDRCDGRQPRCGPCMRANRVCSYYPSKKRGLRTGYVRSLEILLGLVFKAVRGSESWMLAVIDSNNPVALGELADERDAPDILFDAWRSSSVVKEVERLLCLAESVDDDDTPSETLEAKLARCVRKTRAANADSINILPDPNTVPLPTVQRSVSASGLHTTAETVPVSIAEARDTPSAKTADPDNEILHPAPTKQHEPLQLPADWPSLLERYFTYTHCWFPISQKHDLLRTAHMESAGDKNASSPLPAPSLGDRAYLWAVLAFSYHQSLSPEAGSVGCDSLTPNPHEGQRIHDKANLLIHEGDLTNTYQLGHVQALLLLTLLHMDRQCWDTAWLSVGKAVYLAICLAQVKFATQQPKEVSAISLPSHPADITDSTRRVLLGCFVLETLIAARLGRRTYFRSMDIQLVGLLQVDGIEEWERWRPTVGRNVDEERQTSLRDLLSDQAPGFALSTFNQYVQLTGLLNDCLVQSGGSSYRSPESHVHGLTQNLRDWRENLSARHLQSTCSLYEPPQILSVRLTSLSVAVLIQTSKISLAGGINLDISGTQALLGNLHDMCSGLEKRLHILGPDCVPPCVQGCLYILCQALERQAQCQGDLLLKRDMQAMQISLGDLNDLCSTAKQYRPAIFPASYTPQSDVHMSHSPPNTLNMNTSYFDPPSGQGFLSLEHTNTYLSPSTQRESEDFEHIVDRPLVRKHHLHLHGVGNQPRGHDGILPVSSLGTQGMYLDIIQRHSPEETNQERVQSSHNVATADTAPENTTSPTSFTHDTSHDSLSELLGNDMEEDALFDSLATLDSVEWFANPPLFMEHLGMLKAPVATDISTLFDG